jgi:hypothetical protein
LYNTEFKESIEYEGEFFEDKFNGHGIFKWVSCGSKYEGQFKDNMRHGRGKMIWKDGSNYEGDWS